MKILISSSLTSLIWVFVFILARKEITGNEPFDFVAGLIVFAITIFLFKGVLKKEQIWKNWWLPLCTIPVASHLWMILEYSISDPEFWNNLLLEVVLFPLNTAIQNVTFMLIYTYPPAYISQILINQILNHNKIKERHSDEHPPTNL